jgi:hypothetical protein
MKKKFTAIMMVHFIIGILFCATAFAGQNIDAGIEFDLDATTPGNQNVYHIDTQSAGIYIRVDVYATDVHNLDTYEFEVLYDASELTYISSSATNPITFEENILTTNGGTAIGWMVDDSNIGVLSIAYTLAGTDTLEAPEGDGLIADIVFQTQTTTTSTLDCGVVHYFDSFGERDTIINKGKAILFDCGFISGTITDDETELPIGNTIITAIPTSGTYTYQDTSDTNGNYFLDMMIPDIYELSVHAFGYCDTILTNNVITNPDTNYVDISLLHPEIEVSISSLELSLPLDINFDTTMTISNNGNGYLDYDISVVSFPELLLTRSGNSINYTTHTAGYKTKNGLSDFSSIIKPGSNPAQVTHPIKDSAVDSIHYDGDNYGSIGLVAGGEFEAAIRLTPEELLAYHGYYLIGVLHYYDTGDELGLVNVYNQGTPTSPGALITSQVYVAESENWNYNELFSPLRIEGSQEMWIGITCPHEVGNYPMGHDEGPATPGKGDWAKNNGLWDEMANFNMNYNWNIRAIVSPLPCPWLTTYPSFGTIQATQSQDIDLHFNTFSLQDSTYESYIMIENNSSDNLVSIPVTLHAGDVSVDDPHTGCFILQQNIPNPISLRKNQNTATTISYSIPSFGKVSLNIYNIKGQLVDKLVNEEQIPGIHSVNWTPRNVASGIYFYKLIVGNRTATKKILLLK